MKTLSLIAFCCFLVIANTTYGKDHLTLEQLSEDIEKYNHEKKEALENQRKIISLHTYRIFRHHIEGALSIEEYQTRYGVSEENFVKQVFGNMEHITPAQLSSAIEEYNKATKGKIVNSLAFDRNFHLYIEGALTPETYQILYGVSEENFVKQVFGNMEHITPAQLSSAIEEHNKATEGKIVNSLASYRNFHTYIAGVLTPETYQILYGISEENFVKQVFGNMEHITPDQPSRSIEEDFLKRIRGMARGRVRYRYLYRNFNNISDEHNDSNSADILVFAPETYQILYGVSEKDLLKKFFKKAGVYLTLEQLPRILEEHNKNAKRKITSLSLYNEYSSQTNSKNISDIDLTLGFEGYQWLYGITEEEFIKQVFGNMEHLTPDQLSNAITKYNTTNSKRITSLNFYRDFYSSIKGALAPDTYQILYGITEEEFIEQVFGNIEHLSLEELSNATIQHNNTVQSASERITSFFHFKDGISPMEYINIPIYMRKVSDSPAFEVTYGTTPRKYIYIPGALSFDTYQILYGITEEEFIKSVFGNKGYLSLEQLPNAIAEYNENADESEKITSVKSYIKYYYKIPGTLDYKTYHDLNAILIVEDLMRLASRGSMKGFSLEQILNVIYPLPFNSPKDSDGLSYHYEEPYNLTEENFVKLVFGNMDHLSLEQLPNAVAEYNKNADKSEKINHVVEYIKYYYKIPGALALETYQTLYRISEEEFIVLMFGINIRTGRRQSIEIFSLKQLPSAIEEHNKKRRKGKHNTSLINSLERYQKRRHLIQAFSSEVYQRINGITEEEFIKQVFGNIEHLTPAQLPNAIRKNNSQKTPIKGFSTYLKRYNQIPGALSFETYQILYGVTKADFVNLVFKSTRTGQSVETLSLKQLPSAIEEHNKKPRNYTNPLINSLERYQKYGHFIPGALSIEEYQTRYGITEEEFIKQVFGNMEHLTPAQLPNAIRKHNSQKKSQIKNFSNYQAFYTQIPEALSFEIYGNTLWSYKNRLC